jgi:hypothetical protein
MFPVNEEYAMREPGAAPRELRNADEPGSFSLKSAPGWRAQNQMVNAPYVHKNYVFKCSK